MTFGRKITPAVHVAARVGCFSVGTVYVLIGVWAMLALHHLAEPAADEKRILQRMLELPFGGVVIGAIALGTVGYILWLVFEAVVDPYRFGTSGKGLVQRSGTALSALGYGVIVSAALRVLVGSGDKSEEQQQQLVGQVLDWPGGQWLVGFAALVVIVAGACQIKYVWDGEHRRRVCLGRRGGWPRVLVDVLGWAGYGARCAILLVVGGFLLRAAWSLDSSAVGDTDSAFDFFGLGGGPTGDAVFTVVATSTIAYGVFLYLTGGCFDFGRAQARARGRRAAGGPKPNTKRPSPAC